MLMLLKAAPDGHGVDADARYRAHGEPTPAQIEAGNYTKRLVDWNGLQIRVENEAGSVRYGRGWQTRMLYPYGYIVGTLGVDADPVDVYLGPDLDGAPMVYVVHQRKYGAWDQFDEDKAMLGFASEADAAAVYLKHYDDPRFLGPITAMPVGEFVDKVRSTRDAPKMIKGQAPVVLLLKTHVQGYVRKDGTAVRPHDDKRGSATPARQFTMATFEASEDGKTTVGGHVRRPMYVSRKVLNGADVHAWAVSQGFEHITPPDKMHVTVAYSRTPVVHETVGPDDGTVMAAPAGLALLGDKDDEAHVLHIEHPRLRTRFQHMLDHGASWDHDASHYRPHVTISYRSQSIDHGKVTPYRGEIHLGPERVEPLKSGWGGSLVGGEPPKLVKAIPVLFVTRN